MMDADPGVRAGIFAYDAHPVRGFPGSALPYLGQNRRPHLPRWDRPGRWPSTHVVSAVQAAKINCSSAT